jgi:hypothetical protein
MTSRCACKSSRNRLTHAFRRRREMTIGSQSPTSPAGTGRSRRLHDHTTRPGAVGRRRRRAFGLTRGMLSDLRPALSASVSVPRFDFRFPAMQARRPTARGVECAALGASRRIPADPAPSRDSQPDNPLHAGIAAVPPPSISPPAGPPPTRGRAVGRPSGCSPGMRSPARAYGRRRSATAVITMPTFCCCRRSSPRRKCRDEPTLSRLRQHTDHHRYGRRLHLHRNPPVKATLR